MNFKVFYGVSLKYEDNTWLHKELSRYGTTEIIDVADFWFQLRQYKPRSVIGQLLHVFIAWIQAIKLILSTNKKDIIVTRSHNVSLVFMLIVRILHLKRRMVAYNWIDIPKKRYAKLARIALENENFIPVVNARWLMTAFREKYQLTDMKGIYIPDTYDINDVFLSPRDKKQKYIFAGGINNRDWQTLLRAASLEPNLQFKLVANKYLWQERDIPFNVEVIFDLTPDKYYELLCGAYICVVPLKEDKVSGLINIIKAHQYGIPCVTVALGCTDIYYPPTQVDVCMYKAGEAESLAEKIRCIYAMSEKEYVTLGNALQCYLREEFSPTKLVKVLIDYLQHEQWITGEEAHEVCGNSNTI